MLRAAILVLCICLLGIRCGPPPPDPWTISSVVLSGPATLPNNGLNGTYTVVISIGRAPGNTGTVSPQGPWWLVEHDDFSSNDLMSFVPGVTFPPGVSSRTITMDLGCINGTVRGMALTGPGGSPNDPDSGEGSGGFGPDSGPADVDVVFQGRSVSNAISIACI